VEYRAILKLAYSFLESREKLRIICLVVLQAVSNLLDLIAVVSFSTASVLSTQADFSSNRFIRLFPYLTEVPREQLTIQLFGLGFICLLIKTFLSFFVTKKLFVIFAVIQTRLSSKIFFDSLFLSEHLIRKLGGSSLGRSIVNGGESVVVGILGGTCIIFVEISLLAILVSPILVLAPFMAVIASLFILVISFTLYKTIGTRSKTFSGDRASGMDDARNSVRQMTSLSKIIKIRGKEDFFINRFETNIFKASYGSARSHIIQQIPKYSIEVLVVLSGVAVGSYYYVIGDIAKGIGAISLLIVITFRLIPSLLRLQGAFLLVKGSMGESDTFIDLSRLISNSKTEKTDDHRKEIVSDEIPRIEISDVSFQYPDANKKVLNNFSVEIRAGELVLFKGPSGAGKTTLVDILLGLLPIDIGTIRFIPAFPKHRRSYMSQDTVLVNGNVWENISLETNLNSDQQRDIVELSENLNLFEFLPDGLETYIGTAGINLSGGQIQKIGLARALFGSPTFIVLDEPTSSLDKNSAHEIRAMIQLLKGSATTILICHNDDFDEIADQIIEF
jgi:ABC-type multidrug transport system fused ATPase/permease subunit